jgi:integrase
MTTEREGDVMKRTKKTTQLFADYLDLWIETYKVGAVRQVTLNKYYINAGHVRELAPTLTMANLNRQTYQKLLNDFSKTHEKQTTADFHTQVKACIKDALHEDILEKDPTYKAVIKGKEAAPKKVKFLSEVELGKLINALQLGDIPSRDWLILFLSKTGTRFAEALGVTPADFDFSTNKVTINKTWNYKESKGGFSKTKNATSVREIVLDQLTAYQMKQLIKGLPKDEPIFVEKDKRVFNSTVNAYLEKLCKELDITVIAAHALRHTHASVLLANGVSMLSVSKRLGHSDTVTTQRVYSHITDELDKKDADLINRSLMAIRS